MPSRRDMWRVNAIPAKGDGSYKRFNTEAEANLCADQFRALDYLIVQLLPPDHLRKSAIAGGLFEGMRHEHSGSTRGHH